MPRGVYERKTAAPVPAKAAQTATATLNKEGAPAFRNMGPIQAVQQTDGPEGVSTSERLFGGGDEITPQEETPQTEVTEPETPQAPEPPKPPQPEAPKPEEPKPSAASQELDVEEFFQKYGDRKKKLKIDGEVVEVSLKDLERDVQVGKHLHRVAQTVGQERKALAEERRQLEELRQHVASQGKPSEETEEGTTGNPTAREIEALKVQLATLTTTLSPAIHSTARQQLAEELRAEGYSDFMEYIPRMDQYVATVPSEQLFHFYNTPEGAKSLFYKLKAEDLRKGQAAPVEPKKEAPAQEKADKKAPPVVKIDGGSPSSAGIVDDWQAKYNEAFRQWQKNPKDRVAFSEVMRLKGYLNK